MKNIIKPLLYTAAVLCMAASCNNDTVSNETSECSKLPTVTAFKDQEGTINWHTSDYPEIEGIVFKAIIERTWVGYRICSLPKEAQIDGLKIRCSGRTVKTEVGCGPNVKGCNLNSVIVDSFVILENPSKK